MHHPPGQPRHPHGFSLVEAAVSIVIVGVMFVAAITTVGGAAQGRRVQAEWRLADTLGRSLLGEVAQHAYGSTNGTVASLVVGSVQSDRQTWATLDDYAGLVDSPPTSRTGVKLSGLSGAWRREVLVERVNPADPSGAATGSSDYGLKRISVTVTAPSGKQTVLATLRSRWGWPEPEVAADLTRVQAAVVHLRLVGGADVYAGGLMANSPTLAAAANLTPEPPPTPAATLPNALPAAGGGP